MKKIIKMPLAAAVSTAVVSIFSTTTVNAETNPFALTELSDGYMQVAGDGYSVVPWGGETSKKANEASCGEGKCGGMMDKDEPEKMEKGEEHSCGSMMKGKEGSCGDMDQKTEKTMEGKKDKMRHMEKGDGEMSCGDMMEKMKKMKEGMNMDKGGEMSCGAMMEKMKKMKEGMNMDKGEEHSCGAMKE